MNIVTATAIVKRNGGGLSDDQVAAIAQRLVDNPTSNVMHEAAAVRGSKCWCVPCQKARHGGIVATEGGRR